VSEEWLQAASRPRLAARVDPSVPNVARVWNYLIGGRDNFEADRQAAKQLVAAAPVMEQVAPASRAFLSRTVTYLAADAGIRQFLDIGTGMPTAGNTHEVAQEVDPACRVVYVDNDPVVLAHARALLKSTPQGACDYIEADLRNPEAILAEAARTLDFGKPVALMLLAVLQFIADTENPYALVSRLLAALPSGSYLVVSHPTDDFNPNRQGESIQRYNERVADQATLRGHDETERFFAGLNIVAPGVVAVAEWRPDSDLDTARPSSMWCGVARKP